MAERAIVSRVPRCVNLGAWASLGSGRSPPSDVPATLGPTLRLQQLLRRRRVRPARKATHVLARDDTRRCLALQMAHGHHLAAERLRCVRAVRAVGEVVVVPLQGGTIALGETAQEEGGVARLSRAREA